MSKEYIENVLALCESNLDLALREPCGIHSPHYDLISNAKEILGLLLIAIDKNTITN